MHAALYSPCIQRIPSPPMKLRARNLGKCPSYTNFCWLMHKWMVFVLDVTKLNIPIGWAHIHDDAYCLEDVHSTLFCAQFHPQLAMC